MDKIIEYLSSKGKVELVGAIIFFVFFPIYVIEFLYFQEWYQITEVVKITILNIGIFSISYVVQVIIYVATNMMFTKKGRTDTQILYIPCLVLGIVVHLACWSRVFIANLGIVISILSVVSVVIDILIAVMEEKNLKLFQEEIT